MSIDVDVHPDDLLNRARRAGALSHDERLYLEAHLRECSTCRFIRDAARSFDVEAAQPAAVMLNALIERTMRRAQNDGGRAARRSPRRLAVGAMTAAVMLGGVAFAGYWGQRHPSSRLTPLVASSTPIEDPAAVDDVAPAIDRSAPVVGEAQRHHATVSHRVALVDAPIAVERPDELFAAANRARRRGEIVGAEAAYQALWAKFRDSAEAVTSRAVYGRWMLDRGKPQAAIALFQQYLSARPDGDLEEDVLVGLAAAQERIHESTAAIATWKRLLAEHPGSVHADRAREWVRRLQAGTSP